MFPQTCTYRPNPNAQAGLGAYYAPKYETPISGLGETSDNTTLAIMGAGLALVALIFYLRS